MLCNHLFY